MPRGGKPPTVETSVGDEYGRLTVTSEPFLKNGRRRVWCECACGKILLVSAALLVRKQRSCGCVRGDKLRAYATIHGCASYAKGLTDEYRIWLGMIQRCHNARNPNYPYYGGRGILVCDRWREAYVSFVEDVGKRPSSAHSLDRVDNDKGYEPGNVRWATRSQQNSNTRSTRWFEQGGRRQTLTQWATELGYTVSGLARRLGRLPVEEALVPKKTTR